MIQISKMNQYWAKAVFVLLLLKPSLSFAEGSDPFDNTILTFEDKIESTEPIETIESIPNQETTNQSDTGLTKVARDAYSATANKASNGTPSILGTKIY